MKTGFVVVLLVVVFLASGLFYKQVFQDSVVETKEDRSKPLPAPTNQKLQAIPEQSGTQVNTKNTLNLSNQGLEKLPAYVLKTTSLEELNISQNNISGALPAEIRELRNLKILNASDNVMTGVPAEVGQLENLEVLNLSNNKLTGLPNELANLKKLKVLNLSGNNYSQQDLDGIKKGLPSDVEIIVN